MARGPLSPNSRHVRKAPHDDLDVIIITTRESYISVISVALLSMR